MANEGTTKPTYSELEAELLRVRGLLQRAFCEKHQPNEAVQYAGCWACSREEETELLNIARTDSACLMAEVDELRAKLGLEPKYEITIG